MKRLLAKITVGLVLLALLGITVVLANGYRPSQVDDIKIGVTLGVHQTLAENWRMQSLIRQSLKQDSQAFLQLTYIDCGGGSGCYDLGSVLTQIIYKLGEENTIKMISAFNEQDKVRLISLVEAGTAYGDHNNDGVMDDSSAAQTFPQLHSYLLKDVK